MDRFPAQSRVCFIGDSITHNNGFVSRIAAHYKLHLPEAKVRIWNNGISGGSARSANLFFDEDVRPIVPTHAAIMLGVNDSDRNALTAPEPERSTRLDTAFEHYCTEMDRLCDRLAALGCQVTLCTPVPYAEFQPNMQDLLPGGNALIFRYAEHVREMARTRGLPLVDYHARMSELYLNEPLYGDEPVHPNEMGHYRMAEYFLRTQGLKIDPYAPLADVQAAAGLTEWAALTAKIRDVYAAEKNFLPDCMTMTSAQKIERIQQLLAEMNARDGQTILAWKTHMFRHYLEIAPHRAASIARLDQMIRDWYPD